MRIALNKRADLSMSTIVMAIIALLILIVLATMIVRNLGNTNEQINVCRGTCADSCDADTVGYGKTVNTGMVCLNALNKPTGQVCCV